MDISVEKTKRFTLVLNDTEARWLAGRLQNPANNMHPSEEDMKDKRIRQEMFEKLYKELYRDL